MIGKIFDTFVAIIFTGITIFGASALYDLVKREALTQVGKGLSPITPYTRALTGEHYSWED